MSSGLIGLRVSALSSQLQPGALLASIRTYASSVAALAGPQHNAGVEERFSCRVSG